MVAEAVGKISGYIGNLESTHKSYRIIHALGETFYRQIHVSDNSFYLVVQYVGSVGAAYGYKYEGTLRATSGDEKIQVSRVTTSVQIDIERILKSGSCIKIHYDFLKNFVDENVMKFKTEKLNSMV
jgi:hypothetical protein